MHSARQFSFHNLNKNITLLRSYSYKPVKRPNLNNLPASKQILDSNLKTNVSLPKQLAAKILATGPITVADYMKEVLTNPIAGYYMTRDVFGCEGDFITSPEIGQIFGELVAVWCISEWEKCGSPTPLQLVELGPGRGTLMQDILRVFAKFNLKDNLSLHFVEVSPHLSKLQAQRLGIITKKEKNEAGQHYQSGETTSGIKVFWYQRIEDVPRNFSIFLAHEFFDALPIHKFQRNKDDKLREILIDLDLESSKEEIKFRYVISKTATPMLNVFLSRNWIDSKIKNEQKHIEYSIEMERIIEQIAMRIQENGGFSLIMDYGHQGEKNDTFRAFKNHRLHDPLIEAGSADLTADVDFKSMKCIAEQEKKVITFGPVEQQVFLKKMGGDLRLKSLLSSSKTSENSELLKSAYEMLTNPEKMGSRYKFFAIFPKTIESHLMKFPVNGFS